MNPPPIMSNNPEVSSFCDAQSREIPILPTALWIGSYLGAMLLLKYAALPASLKIAVAIVPVIPFVFFIRRFLVHLRNLDELQRRVHFEALAYAFPITILLLMTLGLLERANIIAAEKWSYEEVWLYLPLFYLVGLAISWRRYR
ncbi:MAG: hypothetical protein AVDCRST_MAG42-2192 [uncultured Chthoniobacterales bacterium]|uniref:Uncharacterized protein n=1 Tax=uncultured Chthoniobacterales bacterium TaxID=1836801 RepID=A0A6J4IF06_9BACT|nr:MAG: hypothetical protein AVDCRST_MAG42-2192 [uncultured Chthoniobacterales bacterium]